jgi:hypothetical protein
MAARGSVLTIDGESAVEEKLTTESRKLKLGFSRLFHLDRSFPGFRFLLSAFSFAPVAWRFLEGEGPPLAPVASCIADGAG